MDWPLKLTPSIFPLWACPWLAYSGSLFFPVLKKLVLKSKKWIFYIHLQLAEGVAFYRIKLCWCIMYRRSRVKLDLMPFPVSLSYENIFFGLFLKPQLKGSIFHPCRRSFCRSLNGRNYYPNRNALQSPPSKQTTLIVWLLWCMACLNEVICHRGSEKSINNRAIIYSSKLIGEA